MSINYKDIELSFDFVNFGQPYEHVAYLNLHTGKTHWYSEFGDNEEDYRKTFMMKKNIFHCLIKMI
jgi:hypothetical protein